jgi:polygalacturonase
MSWSRRRFVARAGQALATVSLAPYAPLSAQVGAVSSRRPVPAAAPASAVRLDVREFGAAGDGRTKDTAALQAALDRAFVLGGGEVVVSSGTYLTGTLTMHSGTTLRLAPDAVLQGSGDLSDYPLAQVRWEGKWRQGYSSLLVANDAQRLAIVGPGRIVASPEIRGRVRRDNGMRHPALMEFIGCRGLRVEDCTTLGNDMWSTHPVYCEDVVFRNVTVHGGADGIDVDSCRNVVIDGCTFETGDDCISLKSGRGAEGLAIARPTENVRIRNCTFADAHWACIGIGSETSAGVRDVLIEHCVCKGAKTFAIYIKSRIGRGAFLEDITVRDFEVAGVGGGFLRVNGLDSGKQDEVPVPGEAGIPTLRNFRFRDIRVHDVPVLVQADSIAAAKPLEGLLLQNIRGTCAKGLVLANIKGARLQGISVTGFAGPLLSTRNVTGTGLSGAVPLPFPAKSDENIPPPAAPYRLQ